MAALKRPIQAPREEVWLHWTTACAQGLSEKSGLKVPVSALRFPAQYRLLSVAPLPEVERSPSREPQRNLWRGQLARRLRSCERGSAVRRYCAPGYVGGHPFRPQRTGLASEYSPAR